MCNDLNCKNMKRFKSYEDAAWSIQKKIMSHAVEAMDIS